ncbi:methyltransferase domain-containing protein [Reyranella sp.]|uniref:methyltransferase domain-containing protein n=1 Tax=Reyranella sp. TaxID=1929291 RepID=UPI003BAA294C
MKPRLVREPLPEAVAETPAALQPSEYTAALIQVLQARRDCVRGASVLEVGSGSGVVLAALGALGAAQLCGIDIEEDAVSSGMLLLAELGHSEAAEFYLGDMWLPVAGRRFDMVVANLPHFPMERADVPGRLPTWSAGGASGRALLDPFLEGLDGHLGEDGRAFITHNAFVGLERSRVVLARSGLEMRSVLKTLVYISPEKRERMTNAVMRIEDGCTIHCYGPYAFGEMHVVEIARAGQSLR